MEKQYVIASTTEKDDEGCPLYWSNLNGWGDFFSADVFEQHDKDTLNLPIGGEWEELPEPPLL